MGVGVKIFIFSVIIVSHAFSQVTYDLPLLIVNSNGQEINESNKVSAKLYVINNGSNTLADTLATSAYTIGIKVRGQTSATFPKKGYALSFQNASGSEAKAPFLGLPEGEHWVLHGPYVDKTLIRNALAHWLFQQTGRYSPRFKFTEFYLNGEYRGVYLLLEKIKRGKARIDISKLKETDIAGDDITGGYLWSIDKVSNNSSAGLDKEGFKSNGGSPIVLRYPKKENMTQEQLSYIKDFVNKIESTCVSGNINENGCASIVDFDAAVDYMMHQEITKNTDAYICSFYMFKDKDSKGGKLQLGAPWDFNLAFGAVNYSDGMKADGWQIETNSKSGSMSDYFVAKWVQNIWNDSEFKKKFEARWKYLRSGVWHSKNIDNFIDSLKTLLKNGAARNFERWPNLGKASGMNDPDPLVSNNNNGGFNWNFGGFGFGGMTMNGYSEPTWEAEIEHMRKYVKERIAWIDNQFNFTEPTNPVIENTEPANSIVKESVMIFNSVTFKRENFYTINANNITIHSSRGGKIELVDLYGRILLRAHVNAGSHELRIPQKAKNINFFVTLNRKLLRK